MTEGRPDRAAPEQLEAVKVATGLLDAMKYGPYPYAATAEFQQLGPQVMRDLLTLVADQVASLTALQEQLEQWQTWGVIEIGIRNVNVASYMEHWEGRATKAEAEVTALREQLDTEQSALQDEARLRKEADEAVGALAVEVAALKVELVNQWLSNHYEHCGHRLTAPWPHAGDCHWPLPDVLTPDELDTLPRSRRP